MTTLAILIFTLAIMLGCVWLSFRTGLWDSSDAVLWERYGSGSKVVQVGNMKLRVKDEGSGPVVILAHGAFGNLNLWNSWANILTQGGYRVVRFDGPPEGLSDFDEQGHSHARLAELMILLADELDIDCFGVGGTSRGGQAAMICASKNPDRVTDLILMQTPVFNYKLDPFPKKLKFAQFLTDTVLAGYRPKFYWWQYLGHMYDDQSALRPEIVREYTDFANRSGHRRILAAIQSPGQTRNRDENQKMVASIETPTLVLATPNDTALSLEHQKILASWFPRATARLIVMPDGGHFPSLERGKETGMIIKQFLDGNRSDA